VRCVREIVAKDARIAIDVLEEVENGLRAVAIGAEGPEAKAALLHIHDELNHVNPSAARSLEEGLEETLTLHRLKVPVELCKTLRSTNVIESAFSIVRVVCRNVKRWRPGNQVERWARPRA
jgi:hypothetical protein